MSSFAGTATDLEEKTSYELDALEFVRKELFQQNETPGTRLSVNLGDEKVDGLYPCTRTHGSFVSTSAQAVRSSLSRFRPLTFSAAFKVQDMIAEWVLRANGSDKWRFEQKLRAYDDFRKSGTFIEPNTFLSWPELSLAFWELYRELVRYRRTVIHGGGISLTNGTLTITESPKIPKPPKTLKLSNTEQGAYVRAMCLLIRNLLGDRALSDLHKTIVANDFTTLKPIHNQPGFTVQRSYSFQSMHVTVPSHLIQSFNPIAINIDFDDLKTQMERAFPVPSPGVLLFELSIQVEEGNRVLLWEFPYDSIPVGRLMLNEGDAATDKYLSVKSK
jgi:hypothetical protein